MEYVIAVLPSRTQVMAFYQFLRRIGVSGVIVDTPREISKSCSLCVKFAFSSYARVKSLCGINYSSAKFYKFTGGNFGKISLLSLK